MEILILPVLLSAITFAFYYYMVGHKDAENEMIHGIGAGLLGTTVFAWIIVAVIWAWDLATMAVS